MAGGLLRATAGGESCFPLVAFAYEERAPGAAVGEAAVGVLEVLFGLDVIRFRALMEGVVCGDEI